MRCREKIVISSRASMYVPEQQYIACAVCVFRTWNTKCEITNIQSTQQLLPHPVHPKIDIRRCVSSETIPETRRDAPKSFVITGEVGDTRKSTFSHGRSEDEPSWWSGTQFHANIRHVRAHWLMWLRTNTRSVTRCIANRSHSRVLVESLCNSFR